MTPMTRAAKRRTMVITGNNAVESGDQPRGPDPLASLNGLPYVPLWHMYSYLDPKSLLLVRLVSKRMAKEATAYFRLHHTVYFEEDIGHRKCEMMEDLLLRREALPTSSDIGDFPMQFIHLDTFLPVGITWPTRLNVMNVVRDLTVSGIVDLTSSNQALNDLGKMTELRKISFNNVIGSFDDVEFVEDKMLVLENVREISILLRGNYEDVTALMCEVISRSPQLQILTLDLRGWETGDVTRKILRSVHSQVLHTVGIQGKFSSLAAITDPLSVWSTTKLQKFKLRVTKLHVDSSGRPEGTGGEFPRTEENNLRGMLWCNWNKSMRALIIIQDQNVLDKAAEIAHVHFQWLTELDLPRLSLCHPFATGLENIRRMKIGCVTVAQDPEIRISKTLDRFVFERIVLQEDDTATKRQRFQALRRAIPSARAVATTSRTWGDILLVAEVFPKSTYLIANHETRTAASHLFMETTARKNRTTISQCTAWKKNLKEIDLGREILLDGETAALFIGKARNLLKLTFVWNENRVTVNDMYMGLKGIPIVYLKETDCFDDRNLADLKKLLPALRCECCRD